MVQVPLWLLDASRGLSTSFDGGSIARGRVYAQQGRVLALATSKDGATVLATVRGRGATYQVVITMRRPGARGRYTISSRCSCPVGAGCKHAVATILAASEQAIAALPDAQAPRVAPWEPVFAALLDGRGATATPGPTATDDEVALQFSWQGGGLPAKKAPIMLRPVRRGRSGRWVKTGISWQSVGYAHNVPGAARRAFEAILKAARGNYSYYSSSAQLTLEDLGRLAFPLLADANSAGIALLTDTPERPIILASQPATPYVEIRRSDDGAIALVASWRLDDEVPNPAATRAVGSPPAMLLIDRPSPGDLLLAATSPAADAATALLRAGTVEVPAEDADRFLTTYYPLLHDRLAVESPDGSVAPPLVLHPRLVCEMTFAHATNLELSWWFAYGEGAAATRLPLRPATPRDLSRFAVTEASERLRRVTEEEDLLAAAVRIIEPHLPGIVWSHAPGLPPRPYPGSGLSGMQAMTFATQVAVALRETAGIEVLTVGEVPDYRQALEPPVVRLALGEGTADGAGTDWFDLDVRVEIDGEVVPFRPLFSALALDEEWLLLESGLWFSLDRPELHRLRALIAEARALSDRDGPMRINRWQAGLWDELTDIGVIAAQSETWSRAVAGLLDPGSLGPIEPPQQLAARLRPYQLEGYRWLRYLWQAGLGGILADDMGLGKTVQALAAILAARGDAATPGDTPGEQAEPTTGSRDPVLVVAPTSVIGTWVDEAAKFAPGLRVVPVTETARRRGSELATVRASADVVVTSYALVRIEADDYQAQPWAAVLLDEAQFVKNPRGRTHQVIRTLPAPVKIAMTGTPLENSLMDLWALLAITAPGLFPRAEVFAELYRRPIESGSDPAALQRLHRRLRPLMLRRTKELVAPELPPKQEQVVRVTLNHAHRAAYDRRLHRERQRVLGLLDDFEKNRIAIFSSLTVLRQLALSPALVDEEGKAASAAPSAKIEAFAEQVAQVAAEGHRALVFSQFTGFLRLVRDRLDAEGIDYAYLDGRTRDRAARIAAWREGAAPVFLISLKAGGFGLTLTEADYVFVLDPWWNPAAESQAVDRTHRIGQDKTVLVYRLIAADTIEEKVLALQERKRELFTRVIDEGGAIDGMLTAEDIRGLLAP